MADKQNCIVVGAGPGNGQALGARFAAAGADVALLARDRQRVESLAHSITNARGHACDVTDPERVAACFERIEHDQGAPDTLIYNAGNMAAGNVEQVSPQAFETTWRINTLGLYHCARAVIPAMRNAGGGQIIVIGATASRRGGANFAAFAAAKAAQHSLAQSMARQLGPDGIHVAVVIVDGVISTPATRKAMPERPDERFLDPAAIAESVYQISRQPRSAWTFELDLRPHAEDW